MILWRETLKLWLFAFTKIPLILCARPKVLEVSDQKIHISIPLKRKTKNHVGSMYFGALAIGADLCIGLLAVHHINKSGKRLTLLFKDFHVQFLKRPMDTVHFISVEGDKVADLVERAISTGERQNATVEGFAAVADSLDDPVAKFTLTLSVK